MTGRTNRPLKTDEVELLRQVLERHDPDLLPELLPRAQVNELSREERRTLCNLISDEFAATGLSEDSEPLPRGLKLEALLDLINEPNLEGN